MILILAAPDSGCNGGPCESPEEYAGIEIETYVDSVPCNGPSLQCQGNSESEGALGGQNPPAVIITQPNPEIPDEDCAITGCGNIDDENDEGVQLPDDSSASSSQLGFDFRILFLQKFLRDFDKNLVIHCLRLNRKFWCYEFKS